MIPFIQISDASSSFTTPERRLARKMGTPPWPVQLIDGSEPVKEWVMRHPTVYLGIIFDPEFWYSDFCWRQWIANSDQISGDYVAVPQGNQNPSWRFGLDVPLYVTLRQLENASAFKSPAAVWRTAVTECSTEFTVCIIPISLLCRLPEGLTFKQLPEYWVHARQPIQIFGKGWLHAFNAMPDTGLREDLAIMCNWEGTVLELGCDSGMMAANIRRRQATDVCWVGLDINGSALERAKSRMQMVVQADLSHNLPFSGKIKFDRIVCGDVLEHLIYPSELLLQLRELITQGGILLASFPNIGHWSVIEDLLEGRWDETPSGTFCITHLRFGTRRTWNERFHQSGWRIVTWESETLPVPMKWLKILKLLPKSNIQELEALRYRVLAVPV